MPRFQVIIEGAFSSAHALRHYHGRTEPLHKHRYRVQVVVEGKRLQNKVKYVTDFLALQNVLRFVIKPFDQVNLNQCPPFNKENPSAENLALHIGRGITRSWSEPGVRLKSVTVWETPETAARYIP
jgi:6-pyruvoyltetrahydropterin/6-carboxytetrahydropterin synthase